MTKRISKGLAALAISALAIAPIAIGTTLISADPAFANPGNSVGKGGDRGKSAERGAGGEQHASNAGGANQGGMGKGAIASELKGLNAAHAVANGKPKAAANSQVGRIVTYQKEAIETNEAYDAWIVAYENYMEFIESYDGPTSEEAQMALDAAVKTNADIDKAIEDLGENPDPEAVATLEEGRVSEEDIAKLEQALADAKAFEADAEELAKISNDLNEIYEDELEEEEAALLAASGGRELSDEALAALREKLGL